MYLFVKKDPNESCPQMLLNLVALEHYFATKLKFSIFFFFFFFRNKGHIAKNKNQQKQTCLCTLLITWYINNSLRPLLMYFTSNESILIRSRNKVGISIQFLYISEKLNTLKIALSLMHLAGQAGFTGSLI